VAYKGDDVRRHAGLRVPTGGRIDIDIDKPRLWLTLRGNAALP
jgi:hypothetical protein